MYIPTRDIALGFCMCVTDELFGQCLTQQQERFRYRVTAVLLDRLQSLLQTLMKEGEFHMEDYISKHFSCLKKKTMVAIGTTQWAK